MPPVLLHLAIAATYAAVALTGGVILLDALPDLGQPTAYAISAALFLAGLVLHQAVARLAARRAEGRDTLDLRRSQDELRDTVSGLRRDCERLSGELAEVRLLAANAGSSARTGVVAELKLLEGLLSRLATGQSAPEPITEAGGPMRPSAPAPADAELLTLLRTALAENRVELHLQPVVSLPQRKVRFYEAFSRLRDRDGRLFHPETWLPVATAAGLTPTIDNLLLFRCVQLVRHARSKRPDLCMFVNLGPAALLEDAQFQRFLDYVGQIRDLSDGLIFEFAQDELDRDPGLESKLSQLAALGFRLSMDRVTRLDLDFDSLKRRRICFLKVDAAVLLSPEAQAGATIASIDLKDALARAGVDLIVDKIEAERTVVELLDYGVDFGQGFLFGEPRPAREPEAAQAA